MSDPVWSPDGDVPSRMLGRRFVLPVTLRKNPNGTLNTLVIGSDPGGTDPLRVGGNVTILGTLAVKGSAGAGTLTLDTTTGAAADATQFIYKRGGTNKWRIGVNILGGNADEFEIYDEAANKARLRFALTAGRIQAKQATGTHNIDCGAGAVLVISDTTNGATAVVSYHNGVLPNVIWQSGGATVFVVGAPGATQIQLSANGAAGISLTAGASRTTAVVKSIFASID